MTKKSPPWLKSNQLMEKLGLDWVQTQLAQIWAARDQTCPKCTAGPGVACRNLTGIKNFGFSGARENKYPHTERIDYRKLEAELEKRLKERDG